MYFCCNKQVCEKVNKVFKKNLNLKTFSHKIINKNTDMSKICLV